MSTRRTPQETLAALLRDLPPAPEGWVRAAQELPRARREIEDIVSRAEADADFRGALIADLEAALAAEGYAPERAAVEELRRRLDPGTR